MRASSSRPGYVYVMANPSLPNWRKVGHTHRPPHRRAKELSRTAVPTPFEVEYARFFWDALAAERHAHRTFARHVGLAGRSKEFFQLPLELARRVLRAMPDQGSHARGRDAPLAAELSWEDTLEGREDLWAWAEDDSRSADPARRREGWRAMERLSASGWAEGSWRLSDKLLEADMTLAGGERAAWVLDAAAAQGIPEASLRAAWLRSWDGSAESFAAWVQEVDALPALFGGDSAFWPTRVTETLAAEQKTWAQHPERRLQRPWATPQV